MYTCGDMQLPLDNYSHNYMSQNRKINKIYGVCRYSSFENSSEIQKKIAQGRSMKNGHIPTGRVIVGRGAYELQKINHFLYKLVIYCSFF